LQNRRAEYGKQIVLTVSAQLERKYGRNFELRNLRRMMQFAEQFPDWQIVSPVATQLSWSHFVELLPVKSNEAQLFYARKVAEERLGKRELRRLVEAKAFERAGIANAQLSLQTAIPLNTFKDPYILDFLNLKDGYLENNLEAAVLRELERFILKVGSGLPLLSAKKEWLSTEKISIWTCSFTIGCSSG
jgi:predicted nuclease of restriction endonuclease-like (RecB) superfamily